MWSVITKLCLYLLIIPYMQLYTKKHDMTWIKHSALVSIENLKKCADEQGSCIFAFSVYILQPANLENQTVRCFVYVAQKSPLASQNVPRPSQLAGDIPQQISEPGPSVTLERDAIQDSSFHVQKKEPTSQREMYHFYITFMSPR